MIGKRRIEQRKIDWSLEWGTKYCRDNEEDRTVGDWRSGPRDNAPPPPRRDDRDYDRDRRGFDRYEPPRDRGGYDRGRKCVHEYTKTIRIDKVVVEEIGEYSRPSI